MTLARQTPAPDFLALLAGRAKADDSGIKPRLPTMYESRQGEGSRDDVPIGNVPAAPIPPPPEPRLTQHRPALNASNPVIQIDRDALGRNDAGPARRNARSILSKAAPQPHQEPTQSVEPPPRPEPDPSSSRRLIAKRSEPRLSLEFETLVQPPPTFPPESRQGQPTKADQPLVIRTDHERTLAPIGLTPAIDGRSDLARALERDVDGRSLSSRNEAGAQNDQVINVTIGRIEVRAAVSHAPPHSPAPLSQRNPPQSLTDYLKSREGGR